MSPLHPRPKLIEQIRYAALAVRMELCTARLAREVARSRTEDLRDVTAEARRLATSAA